MRDPKKIEAILKEIEKVWKANPGLRLCQLIENCFTNSFTDEGHNHCIYNKEDELLLKKLKEVYKIQ